MGFFIKSWLCSLYGQFFFLNIFQRHFEAGVSAVPTPSTSFTGLCRGQRPNLSRFRGVH